MPALAAAGYHVVAPDLRGYGRTTGWAADYDADLRPFRLLNAVRDTLGLASALGYRRVAGCWPRFRGGGRSLVRACAARCVRLAGADERALRRPAGAAIRYRPPSAGGAHRARPSMRRWPPCHGRASTTSGTIRPAGQRPDVALSARRPRFPARLLPPQERRLEGEPAVGSRLERGRSWRRCRPTTSWTWTRTCRPRWPRRCRAGEIAATRWLPDDELAFTAPNIDARLPGRAELVSPAAPAGSSPQAQLFSGRTIDVPRFIAGSSDWGTYQLPARRSAGSRPLAPCSAAT